MSLISGTKLVPYEILVPLSAGGMGDVHHACVHSTVRILGILILYVVEGLE